MTPARLMAWRLPGASTLSVGAVAAICVLWAYWTTLGDAAERWSIDPQYSHGLLWCRCFAGLPLWLRGATGLGAGDRRSRELRGAGRCSPARSACA